MILIPSVGSQRKGRYIMTRNENAQQTNKKPVVPALLIAIKNAENGKTLKVYRDSYTIEQQEYNYYSVFGKQAGHDHVIRILPDLGYVGKDAKESEVKGKKGDGYERISALYDCSEEMYLGARGYQRVDKNTGETVPCIEFFVFVTDDALGLYDECPVVPSSSFSQQRLISLFAEAFGAREMTSEEVKNYLKSHKSDEA